MFSPSLTDAISDANNSMTVTPVDILTAKIFVALEFSGGIGMLFLVSTVFLSQVQAIRQLNNSRSASDGDGSINRTRTWISFCVSWIISCFSFCLLFFAGRQFDVDEEPAYGLCLIQATLIYSSPPLTACTTFAVFFDLWRRFRASEMGPTPPGTKGTVMVSLLAAPYVLWIFLTIGILIAGKENPQIVRRDLTSAPYCIMSDSVIPTFVSVLEALFSLAVLVMLIILARYLYRRRAQIIWSSTKDKRQMTSFVVRLMVFGLLGLIAATISAIFVFNRTPGVQTNLAIAILPPGGVLVFGTQKDFLSLWLNLLRWPIRSLSCISQSSRLGGRRKDQLTKLSNASDVEMNLITEDRLPT